MSVQISIKKTGLKKTPVFDSYWKFAAERQRVFLKKLRGDKEPFTDDPVLQEYKFTNAYRASDRVSQYLIRNVIYPITQEFDSRDILFRILLFKTFNKIETWEYLEKNIGVITYSDYSFERYEKLLSERSKKNTLYSGAYIMTSGKSFFGYDKKFKNHLRLLEFMINDNIDSKVQECKSMSELFVLLKSYPTIGNFLAYQYCIDINYSKLSDYSENDFVLAGPGALDGISKCFYNHYEFSSEYLIQYMVDNQKDEFNRAGVIFNNLWGRELHLIDCQNLFCEISKYSRVSYPEIKGISGRKRIKQRYKSKGGYSVWYPPKWGINKYIENE